MDRLFGLFRLHVQLFFEHTESLLKIVGHEASRTIRAVKIPVPAPVERPVGRQTVLLRLLVASVNSPSQPRSYAATKLRIVIGLDVNMDIANARHFD